MWRASCRAGGGRGRARSSTAPHRHEVAWQALGSVPSARAAGQQHVECWRGECWRGECWRGECWRGECWRGECWRGECWRGPNECGGCSIIGRCDGPRAGPTGAARQSRFGARASGESFLCWRRCGCLWDRRCARRCRRREHTRYATCCGGDDERASSSCFGRQAFGLARRANARLVRPSADRGVRSQGCCYAPPDVEQMGR